MSDGALEGFRTLPKHERQRRRAAVRVLIPTGLGLNCEVETEHAFRLAGATPERVHLLDLLGPDRSRRLADYAIVAFPGGFAFGDHLGAGFVFANKIRYRLYDELVAFLEGGGFAIGICNGFQTLVRLGALPGLEGDYRRPRATLAPNSRLGYRNAWVRVAFDANSPCVWTRGLPAMELPSRHGEGRFIAESPEALQRLEAAGQIAVRYVGPDEQLTQEWPHNPNGSPAAVAGICDPSGRVLGLMPHPDAFLSGFQHPLWPRRDQRETGLEPGAGLSIFQNGVDAAAFSRA
jgi:phosphoribosylformylglycinamidine synthase